MDRVLIDILVGWGPMLLLIGVWLIYMRKMQSSSWSPYKINEQILRVNEGVLEEQRKHNERLERILVRMDERIAELERRASP